MTIPSTPRKAGPFLGDGATTSFPFAFKVFGPADIKVVVANSAGVQTTLALNSDYSVTLNPNQDTSPGGTVTYPISGSPLPSGGVLSIIGDIDYDQPLDLPSGGNFSPLALENQLDRTAMQIQQLREEMDRTAKLPPTSSESVEELVDDLQRIADSADNLDTVANSIANVNAVGANIADVATVVDNIANVKTVAGAIANVNAVGANIANVNAVGTNIAKVNTVADNIADVTNYSDTYLGPKASPPAKRNDGSALNTGDLYFNTTTGALCVYNGTAWLTVTAAVANASETASGIVELATAAEVQAGTDNTRAVTPAGLASRTATETASGIVELATAAEAQALASAVVALTPARLADAFKGANQSLAPNGYQRLPGGLIIQWGVLRVGNIGIDYFGTISFPIAFPNRTNHVYATLYSFNETAFDASVAVTGHWLTGFNFTLQEWGAVNQWLDVVYIAIGY